MKRLLLAFGIAISPGLAAAQTSGTAGAVRPLEPSAPHSVVAPSSTARMATIPTVQGLHSRDSQSTVGAVSLSPNRKPAPQLMSLTPVTP